MRNSCTSSLHKEVGNLVRRFGLQRVRNALENVSAEDREKHDGPLRKDPPRFKTRTPRRPPVTGALESIRGSDPEKHYLLTEFLIRLKDREVLPESQDIRFFAQLIGLKEIHGKSRKDMIPTLMHFLLQMPTENVRLEIRRAASISQQQRQEGFSVLADKLLSHK